MSKKAVRSSVNTILQPLSNRIKTIYDQVKNLSPSIEVAVALLKDPEVVAAQAKLLGEIKRSLRNFDPSVQAYATTQVDKMIARAEYLRASQMSEKLENNLVYALYVKAGNPTSLDILPDGKGKFRLMLPKRVVARQNPLQPAGDTIPVRKNRYTYKLHEFTGSITAPHLMADYLNASQSTVKRHDPWDSVIVDSITFSLSPKNNSTQSLLGKFFDNLHGNLYGATLNNSNKNLISEDWGVLEKGYLRKNGFTTKRDLKKIDVPFYRPRASGAIDKTVLQSRIDELAKRYRNHFGSAFPVIDSAKLSDIIARRTNDALNPVIKSNRLTRDDWFMMAKRDPYIRDNVSGIELVPRLCKDRGVLTLLNHNRVEAAQGLGFHIEINISADCGI